MSAPARSLPDLGVRNALSPPQPITRRELIILGLFAIVALTQGWSGAAITHALPFVQDRFEWSDARVFDVLATVRAFSLLALALSWYGDHRGRRRPLLVAFVLLPLGNLITALIVDPIAFTALQSLTRIGTIALASLAVVVLAEEVEPEIRSYAIGIYALFGSMGTGLGLVLRPLGESGPDSWRLLFAMSAVPLLAAPFLVKRLGESRAYVQRTIRPGLGAVLQAPHGRRFWPMAGLAFAISAFTAPAANLALVRLENDLGWSALRGRHDCSRGCRRCRLLLSRERGPDGSRHLRFDFGGLRIHSCLCFSSSRAVSNGDPIHRIGVDRQRQHFRWPIRVCGRAIRSGCVGIAGHDRFLGRPSADCLAGHWSVAGDQGTPSHPR
jgi:hypothetical protein